MGDPDYVHDIARACQRFVGAVGVIEPGAFVAAIGQLTEDLPPPDGAAQSVWMWMTVSAVATRGASAHHHFFHSLFGGSCRFVWPWLGSVDPLSIEAVNKRLVEWAELYARTFDAAHPWPLAVKAAALIQQHPRGSWYAAQLARDVGTSCSTLERGFKTIYRTTPQRYHRLVRLRRTIEAVRSDAGSVEGVALEIGWPSVKDARRAVRRATALTLSGVRHLSNAEVAALMNGPLALPLPRPSRTRSL